MIKVMKYWQKCRDDPRYLVYLILSSLFMAAIIIFTFASVGGVEIIPGQCEDRHFTAYNFTNNQTYNFTEEFCCICQEPNITIINVTERYFINLSLANGETVENSIGNCDYRASCPLKECPPPQAVCEREYDLDAGEHKNIDDGVCILDLTCQKEEADCETELMEQTVLINVTKDKDGFYVASLDHKKEYPLNITQYSDQIEVEVKCPALDVENYTANVEFIEDNCRRWIDRFEDRNIVAWELYADSLKTTTDNCVDTAFNFGSSVLSNATQLRDELITCQQKLNVNDNMARTIADLKEERNSLKADRSILLVGFGLLVLFFILLFVWAVNNGLFEGNEQVG